MPERDGSKKAGHVKVVGMGFETGNPRPSVSVIVFVRATEDGKVRECFSEPTTGALVEGCSWHATLDIEYTHV